MAERRFTVRLDAEMNISQVKSAIQTMQTELSKLNLPQDVGSKLTGTFDKLTGEIEKFQAMSAKGIGSSKDFTQLERSGDKILQLYAQLRNQVQGLGGLSEQQLSKMIPQSALNNIKKASEAYKAYNSSIEKNVGALDKQKTKVEGARAEITRLEQSIQRTQNMKIVANPKDLTELKNSTVQAKNELETLETEATQAQGKIDELTAKLKHPEKSKQIAALQQQLAALSPQIEQARNKYNNLNSQFSNTTTISKQTKELETLRSQLVNAQTNFDTFNNELKELQGADSTALINLVNALNQIPGINLDPTTASLEQVQKAITNLSQDEINQLKKSFAQAGAQVNSAKGPIDQFGEEIDGVRGKVKQLDSQMGEVDMLKSRITYFFGLTNSVYLLRRALTSAMETVKELDKTMTEAAVVTEFSVSDMWNKLPQYTEQASRLGATVNDLYSATTLYYQQGLKTNEAMALGVETMKMARIAGMEASEATEAMTAALRGFNMELNETSATRVNDVYSQLAAVTASDTEQIATAMTKTASIAHSANMEFETTAALLAQIIETTQEAPETAGTAMKTIVARFSEVKELKAKGKSKGEDEEGEEIDVNKIQTALRTVGISMDGFFAGTEGLDSVLLKLAEKWDSLDFETQRYIATMAAGSRQQSRFIAMMSDYERTMELVGEANNSAGASQKQFEKTLDSMEAKLNKLKNEWDRFAMGIADNELIKMGIDLLTGVLKIVNDLTDGISGENGLLKSVINLGLAFGGLKLGGLALTKGLGFFLGIGGGKNNLNSEAEHTKRMSDADLEHKQKLLYLAKEHKQKLAYMAQEAKAGLAGEQAEAAAGVEGEYAEKFTALEGEYSEAMAAAAGEGAERTTAIEGEYAEKFAALGAEEAEAAAGVEGEYAEKFAALESEYGEAMAAVAGESAEAAAAVESEYTEKFIALEGEYTEAHAAVQGEFKEQAYALQGEQSEALAAAAGETAEATVAVEGEYMEQFAAIEGEYIEAHAAIESEYTEKMAAIEGEYAEYVAGVENEIGELTAAIAGEEAEGTAAVAGEEAEAAAAIAMETAEGSAGGIGSFFKKAGSGIGGFFKKNGKMIGSIAGIIGAIAIIGAAVNGFEKSIDEATETAQERLASLKVVEDGLIQSTDELSDELAGLGAKRNNFDKMVGSLDKLNKGSAEWASTMHEIRSEMNDILTIYPELIEYTKVVNGVRILTDEGWSQYENLLTETYYQRMETLYGVKIQQAKANEVAAAEGLQIPTSSVTDEEEAKLQNGVKTGTMVGGATLGVAGWVVGTAAGAKIGTALGTAIAPGIGTIIGAALGVALGAGIGWLAGGGLSNDNGVAPEIVNDVALAASEATLARNGEQIAFSALEATDEEIKEFVNSMNLTTEEAEQLSEYIISNREEFDSHTQALKQNARALYDYGRALGAAKAEEKGYTGQAAETYEDVYANVTGETYDRIYARKKAGIDKADLKNASVIKEIEKATGYTWDSTNNQYTKDGSAVEDFTEEEQRAALTNYRTMQEITGLADKTFEVYSSKGATYAEVTAAMETGKKDEIGQLSVNEIVQHAQQIIDDAVTAVTPYAVTGDQRVNKALELESEGYDTGLYAHSRFFYSDSSGATSTTHNSIAVDKTLATDKSYDTWLKKQQEKYAGDTGKVKRYASAAKNKEIVYNFSSSSTRPNDNWNFGEQDYSGYYDAVHLKTGYDADLVQAYENKGIEGVKDHYNYDIVYGENGNDGMIADVQKYSSLMPFLNDVAMNTAIQFGTMVDGLKTVYDLGIYEQNSKLENTINTIMNGVGEENWTMVATMLANLDFTNLTQLTQFEDWLNDLPGATQEALDAAEGLIDYLEDVGIAFADIDLENLIGQLEGTQKIIKKINDLEVGTDLILSKEELAAVLGSGGNRNDFVATMDGYVYLGNSMDDLRETLQQSNAILLKLQNDALRKKVETGEFIEKNEVLAEMSWGTTGTWTEEQINIALDQMVNTALVDFNAQQKDKDPTWTDVTASTITEDQWKIMTKGTPLEGFGFEFAETWLGADKLRWNGETDEGVRSLLRTWLADTGDAYINKTNYETQYSEGIRDIEEQELSLMTGQEIIDTQKDKNYAVDSKAEGETVTFKAEDGTIISGSIKNGQIVDDSGITYDDVIWDENTNGWVQKPGTYSNTSVQNVLDYQLGQYDGGVVTAERWGQEIASNKDQTVDLSIGTDGAKKSVKDFEMMESTAKSLTKALVVDFKKAEKAQDGLNIAVSDNKDAFKDAEKGSQKYNEALDKITQAAKTVFGNDITTEFVEKNKDLFLQLAEGGETAQTAYEELGMRAAAEFLGMERNSIEFASVIGAVMANIPTDLEIGATFDATQAINNLMALGHTAEEAATLLEKMGYTVTYTTETHYIGDATGTDYGTTKPKATTNNEVVTATNIVVASGVKNDAAGTGFSLSDGKEKSKWENPYDKYYNSVKEINAELRKREQLERQYQRLIERGAATIDNTTKNRKEQLASLEAEKKMREAMLRNRTGQIGDIRSEYSDVAQYAWWDEKLGQVMIDWEGLERLEGSTDDEYTARVEDYISKMEEQQDLIEEEQDKLEDINDVVWEIYNEGKDEYFDLENQIKDAVIASRQKEIDKLSEINSTINDTNSSILESMQKQIDEYRQNRDNEEIEEQIADDERRLMYLQQDTSGANALDILELQKSIDEQKQDYTDTLIDQKITELQEQNEIAAEQRERQINILQTQLDQEVETGKIWQQVKDLMNTGINGEDGLVKGSDLEGILKDAENFEGLSALQQLDWFRNMETNIAAALSWLETGAMQSLFGQGGEISFKDASGDDIKGTIDENGNVVTEYGTFNKADFSMDSSGNVYYGKDINIPGKTQQPVQPETENEEKQITIGGRINAGSAKIYSRPGGSPLLQYFASDPIYDVLDEKNGYILTRWYKSKSTSASGWFKKSDVTAFKTGGLADFTGPAWLDGTKSKPEYILNADQTKAFFQLVDVLSSLRTGEMKTAQNNGDNVYDIDINVESIGSDYDVEQIASTVKRLINDDARYRNNNTINLMR